MSHPTSTAKSPIIRPATTDSELPRVDGVFSDASFSPSIISSTIMSWKNIGIAGSLFIFIKSRAGGTSSGCITSMYHAGEKNRVMKKISVLTNRRYVPVNGGK